MRLDKNYWNKFTKSNKIGKTIRDGLAFENLIKELLPIIYKGKWCDTPATHDNNHDFYLYSSSNNIWIECKNYENDIEMKVVAPTLVMAQIFSVNHIVFFSYSNINKYAREKLYLYGEKTNKLIQIFDGELLDELIYNNAEMLSPKYRPSTHLDTKTNNDLQVHAYYVQNPFLGATIEDRKLISIDKIDKIVYNQMFELCIICENFEAEDKTITIEYLNDDKDESYSLMDITQTYSNNYYIEYKILPASALVNRIFILPVIYQKNYYLPKFKVTYNQNDEKKEIYIKNDNYIKGIWIHQVKLIGSNYFKILNDFTNLCLNNSIASMMLIHGKSGTGKTRLLNESQKILLEKDYKILSFINNNADEGKNILKEILSFLFEIPRFEMMSLDNYSEDFIINNSKEKDIKDFFSLIKKINQIDNSTDINELINEYSDAIFERISYGKYAIIIDNIQFLDEIIQNFILRYIHFANYHQKSNTSIMVLALNTSFMTSNANHILEVFKQSSKEKDSYIIREIKGFLDNNQAKIYLKEMMQCKNSVYDLYLDEIINTISCNPYYLYQTFLYLNYEKALIHAPDYRSYQINEKVFFRVIEKMPDSIYEILDKRWDTLYQSETNELLYILIIKYLYFFQQLNLDIINRLNLKIEFIENLKKAAFVKEDENHVYLFEHDIIESFFESKFPYLIDTITEISIKEIELFSDYPMQYYMLKMDNNLIDLNKSTYKFTHCHVPFRLSKCYYHKWMNYLLSHNLEIRNKAKYVMLNYECLGLIRDKLGSDDAKKAGKIMNQKIINTVTRKPSSFLIAYRKFINLYSDIYAQTGEYENAKDILYESITSIANNRPKNSDGFHYFNSLIYNRLHVIYKELNNDIKRDEYLRKSIIESQLINDASLKNESIYYNLSDEGYNYYDYISNKEKLLSIWRKCLDYPPTVLPQKALNYYRKNAQIMLIENNSNGLKKVLSDAREYIKYGEFSHEKSVFERFFNNVELLSFLQNKSIQNKEYLEFLIEKNVHLNHLLNDQKDYILFWIESIYMHYINDLENIYIKSKMAFENLISFSNQNNFNAKVVLLLENISYLFFIHEIDELNYDLSFIFTSAYKKIFLRKRDQIMFCISKNIFYAHGVMRTIDGKLNLPLI